MVTDSLLSFKHAFVTGGTGIVGVPLCRRLVEMGVRVTVYSRKTGEPVLPDGVRHVQGDVLDRSSVVAAARSADVIFHAAAAVHGSASTCSEFERMNVIGTENVIHAVRELGARLVHVSTVNVEGYRRGALADAYAATKSKAEELVAEAVDEGIEATIVRPATVFGDEAGRAGMIVDRLLAGKLAALPGPSRRISPVWSGDLANALIRAAVVGRSGSTYTVAGPTVSTGEFVRSVCDASGLKRPLVLIPGWIFAVPLQLAWWLKAVTRWTPPISVESLLNGSPYDGSSAAGELGFSYTAIDRIFK